MGVELMDGVWLVIALETAVFLALFHGIVAGCHQARRYGQDAGGAGRMTAERAGAAGGIDDLVASQHQPA
jgi:hypothetical protein